MSRKFTGGNGSDTSAAAYAYMKSTNQLRQADLALIGELEDPMADFLTNYESPLQWSFLGTFKPAVINRGAVTSQIGLQVDTLEFKWSPKLAAFGNSISTANKYQLAMSGFYDSKRLRTYRTVMPTPGDADTYGAYDLFGGRIAKTKVVRGQITFEVNSFLDVINQEVPPNVIELTSTLAGYAGNVPVIADGETTLPKFVVQAPSTQTNILASCTSPTPNKIYGTNKFRYGFMAFLPGSSLAGYWSPIGANVNFNAGGGIHYNQFTVYAPFPWNPTPGDAFYASVQPPINLTDAASSYWYYLGFPYVPAPETNV